MVCISPDVTNRLAEEGPDCCNWPVCRRRRRWPDSLQWPLAARVPAELLLSDRMKERGWEEKNREKSVKQQSSVTNRAELHYDSQTVSLGECLHVCAGVRHIDPLPSASWHSPQHSCLLHWLINRYKYSLTFCCWKPPKCYTKYQPFWKPRTNNAVLLTENTSVCCSKGPLFCQSKKPRQITVAALESEVRFVVFHFCNTLLLKYNCGEAEVQWRYSHSRMIP